MTLISGQFTSPQAVFDYAQEVAREHQQLAGLVDVLATDTAVASRAYMGADGASEQSTAAE